MKSILQSSKVCFVCGSPYVQEHHVFFGTGHRRLSEKYGLKVYLCQKHHTGEEGVHFDPKLDKALKQYAQKKFEESHSRKEFMKIFKRSYL